jgi:type I restriction enzyme S subunit
MDWEKVELTELVSFVSRGKSPTYVDESPIIALNQKAIRWGSIDKNALKYHDAEVTINKDFFVRKGDIVINSTGDITIGRAYFFKEEVENLFADSHVTILRLDKNKLLPEFLIQVFPLAHYQTQIYNLVTGSTGQLELTKSQLLKLKVEVPPLPVQRRIAQVLGRYDALIENYAAQIRSLEASAQNLYREWFVRGRCPFAEYETGAKLPVGWEEKQLGEIAEDKRRIVKGKDLKPDAPYVGLEHLSVKSIVINDWGTAEEVDSDKLSFEKNDILLGKIRPYLHKVCLSHFEGVCSSDTIVIKPTIKNALGFVMFTVFAERFIEFADKISNGTKMPRAEWSVLQTYKLIVPPDEALKAFEEIISSIFAKMENLQMQITKLRQMRDKLLPRLLSGKVPVKISKIAQ